jgi:septal ring factor EnvC (AmiA/AmiB activator)
MTFVGRILVIVIMLFSLIFLGISTVVYSTSKNWRAATQEQVKKVDELKKKLSDAQAQKDAAAKGLEDEKNKFDALAKNLNNEISTLEDQNKRDNSQIQDVRGKLAVAEQNAKSALDEVEARRKETMLLRDQKSSVEKQANEFKLHQAELNDRIRELERMLDTAKKNNGDLLERAAKFSTLLRQNGLSDDITQIKGIESPPPVQGEISRVDATNRRVEMTIGSDDGLVPGHELYVFRTSPRPEYVGKISIVSVDPDQAVGKVVGHTYQGKKIKEGDIVSSTIKPRF